MRLCLAKSWNDCLSKTCVAKQDGGVFALADKLGVSEEATATYAAAKRAGDTDEWAKHKSIAEVIAHVEEVRPDKTSWQKQMSLLRL